MTTDNTAHPAPTPAPVAVPLPNEDGSAIWATTGNSDEARVLIYADPMDERQPWTDGYEWFGPRDITSWQRLVVETERPEPVVAPLPSEAVHAAAASLAEDEDMPQDWDHVVRARNALERALPHLRLIPEDDEDTVRVPRSLIDKYFDLTVGSWHEDATPEVEDVWRFHRDLKAAIEAQA